jgi:adenylosuccinate lyase
MKAHRRPHGIWNRDARLDRWHQIWINILESQREANPRAPINDGEIKRYRAAAREFSNGSTLTRDLWWNDYDAHLKICRHEVVAALRTFNDHAHGTSAHLGMTSCDVTETANQWAIRESLSYVHRRVTIIGRLIADQINAHREQRLVARTHGQPAQLTTLGYRYATLLGPLRTWTERFVWFYTANYRSRPPAGAVGTWADQNRVLAGWPEPGRGSGMPLEATGSASEAPEGIEIPPGHSELVGSFTTGVGHGRIADATRQVYHRSQDLHWMALLAELASIAETWATDRRLESMLGLGAEQFGDAQVGSSAMPHKRNPRFSERICSLATVTRSHLAAFAELASREWLEGDVSGSAARRKLLADAFENIDALLQNWTWVILHWEPDLDAINAEVDQCLSELATGALIQAAIEGDGDARLSRGDAHDLIRRAFVRVADRDPSRGISDWGVAHILGAMGSWPLTEKQTREVIASVGRDPIGDIDRTMDVLITEAHYLHQAEIDLGELGQWLAELR